MDIRSFFRGEPRRDISEDPTTLYIPSFYGCMSDYADDTDDVENVEEDDVDVDDEEDEDVDVDDDPS